MGNFELDLTSYLFYKFKFVTVVCAILLYHTYGRWFADGWLGQGCWYLLVVTCVGKFSPPEGGLDYFVFCTTSTMDGGVLYIHQVHTKNTLLIALGKVHFVHKSSLQPGV